MTTSQSYIWWWKGSVVWSMSMSHSGCVLVCRRESGWLCKGEGGGGHSSAHSTDSTCALNRWCVRAHVCMCVCVRACVCVCAQALMPQMNVGLIMVHMVK